MKGTTPAKKKLICAEMMINTQADFELCLFSEEEEDDVENRVLAISRDVCHCSSVFYYI